MVTQIDNTDKHKKAWYLLGKVQNRRVKWQPLPKQAQSHCHSDHKLPTTTAIEGPVLYQGSDYRGS